MFRLDIEVRYYETDMQKIVHHSNYLRWFELVRTKLLESLDINMLQIENLDIFYVLKEAHIDYIKPVKYGEKVSLFTKLVKYNGVRLRHEYFVKVNDEIRCKGYTEVVNINNKSMLPVNFKKVNSKYHKIILDSVEN